VGIIRGTVQCGRREAAGFVSLPWVAEQIARREGFVPLPGTLNLRLGSPESMASWQDLRRPGEGWVLEPPGEGFCAASCWPVRVEGVVAGVIVLPHVPGYPEDVLEVVAAVHLREHFSLSDGDSCALHLGPAQAFSCVLFDLEGTLVDFQWKLAEAEEELRTAVSALGYDRSVVAGENYAGIRRRAMECAASAVARTAIDERLGPIYDRYDMDALTRWRLRDDTPGLLQELSASGVKLGLVTNIGRKATDGALRRFELSHLLGVVVTRNDVAQLKPGGDGILRALAALGSTGPALMVGDSLSDLFAARNAGISVAIVIGGESSARAIRDGRPDYSLTRLGEVTRLVRNPGGTSGSPKPALGSGPSPN